MARISKKRKEVLKKIEANKNYTLSDASKLVKEISYTKFDSSVDIDVRLGVDPKKANHEKAYLENKRFYHLTKEESYESILNSQVIQYTIIHS